MTHTQLSTIQARILKLASHNHATLNTILNSTNESEHFDRISKWLDNFESASPLFISKADIFKLGEILGTVESLLTNASEE